MPQIRSLPSLSRKYYPLQYALFGLCLISFAIVFVRATTLDPYFYAALAVFVFTGLATLITDRLLLSRVSCPECHRRLTKEPAPRGKFISIQYHCPACDILWDADAPKSATGHANRYADPLE